MFGGGSTCPRCKKKVYFAERATGPGGDWHKSCLVCPDCNKRLDSTTLAEHNGEAYCKSCHGKRYGPKGYGFATGAAGLTCADPPKNADIVNKANPSSPAPAAGGNFCSQCGAAAAGGNFCTGCGNRL